MRQRRHSQDRFEALVCTLAVIISLSVAPANGDLFCPPATANSNYTITAENYQVSSAPGNQLFATFLVDSNPFLDCNLTGRNCTGFQLDASKYPGLKWPSVTITQIGYEAVQVQFTLAKFPENFTATAEVQWRQSAAQTSSSPASATAQPPDSCLVQQGGLVDECSATPNLCAQPSTCQDEVSGFHCLCTPGYNGLTCRAGDMKLYCNHPGGIVFWNQTQCIDVTVDCHVGGLAGQTDIGISFRETFNNVSTYVISTPMMNGTGNFIHMCSQIGIAEGQYEIVYQITSSKTNDTLIYPLYIGVQYDSHPAKFNQPTNGYTFSVPEHSADQSVLVYVNKSVMATCLQTACIEVIDPDTDPKHGIASLFLTVASAQNEGSVKFMERLSADSFGYFYVSGRPEANEKYTFLLAVNRSGLVADTSVVVFTVIDDNDPLECNVSLIEAMVDIRASPPRFVGSMSCADKDPTPPFNQTTYNLVGTGADYFRINDQGIILLQKSLKGTNYSVFNLTASATGYNETSSFYNDVIVYVTVPEPECNLSISQVPQKWENHTRFNVKLQCDIKGIDRLAIGGVTSDADLERHFSTRESSTVYVITAIVRLYSPGKYNFTVTASLGGAATLETVVIAMYNPPQFTPPYFPGINETATIGWSVFTMYAITDIPGARLSWTLKSGDRYSMITPHNGSNEYINQFLSKPVAPYVGENFSIVFEAQDSVSLMTADYTWNFTIIDINQPPVCDNLNPSNINSGMPAGTVIIWVNCSDPDITPAFRNLSYQISTEPWSVHMNISSSGKVTLVQPFPAGLTSFNLTVWVSDGALWYTYHANISVLVVKCPAEKDGYGLEFPETPVNAIIDVNCPKFYTGQVSRLCHLNQTWEPINYTTCRRTDLVAIAEMANQLLASPSNISDSEVAVRLEDISEQLTHSLAFYGIILSGDINQIIDIISTAGELTHRFPSFTLSSRSIENFANVSDGVLGVSDHMWTEAVREPGEEGAVLIEALDYIVRASLRSQNLANEEPIIMNNLVIKRDTTSEDIYFPKPDEAKLQNYNENTMFLSKEAFRKTQERVSYGIILYRNATSKLSINLTLQNDGPLENKVLNSHIFSFTLDVSLPELSPQLELSFTVIERNYSNASCGYLNTQINESGVWASDGCTATRQDNIVKCRCNHMTNFAILMSPFDQPSEIAHQILSIISAVGCGISIFCLLVTVAVYAFLWRYVACDRSVLHVNLAICLILAYTIFLAGVDRTESLIGCKVVAALLHYIYLAVFCIMLSEGLEVFKSVCFVFAKSILWKLLLFAYGVPLVIVAVSLGVTKAEGYGSKNSCWLSTSDGLIWAFVGPVLLILLINTLVLFRVIWIMQKSRHMTDKTAQQRTKSVVRTVCILSPILGITWVFGVLSVNRDTVVFQYLFAVFNSLQGVMIFICYCLISHQVRDGFKAVGRKYQAQSFDSANQVLAPVSGSNKHSDSDNHYKQQQEAYKTVRSTSTARTDLSDSVPVMPTASQRHLKHNAQAQVEADIPTNRSRRSNMDLQQNGRTGHTNYGFTDSTPSPASENGKSVGHTQGRQFPPAQRNLAPVENRAAQWRRTHDAVRRSPPSAIGLNDENRYARSAPRLGYTNGL